MKTGLVIRNFFSPLIYALGITVAIYISIEELHKFNNNDRFFLFSGFVVFILLIENLLALIRRKREVEINLNMNDDFNELWHLFYKFLLPILYYISIVAFGFYNLYSTNILIIIALTFLTFLLLFINTKAFFQNIKQVESRTHYVYDLIKFLIFFTSTNFIVNLQDGSREVLIISFFGMLVVVFSLVMLIVWRLNKIHLVATIFSVLVSIFISLTFLILILANLFNPIQISLGLFFAFYLAVAIIQHALLNTLTKSVIFEYIVILLAVFAVIFGIT